jgi:hypothetical protein
MKRINADQIGKIRLIRGLGLDRKRNDPGD